MKSFTGILQEFEQKCWIVLLYNNLVQDTLFL